MNAQVAQTFIDNIVLSTGTIRDALSDAANGAAQLRDGTSQLDDGVHELADGAGRLDHGASELASGAAALSAGAGEAAGGAGELADGIARLDGGLQELRRQTAAFPEQAAQLDQGARELRDGAHQLDAGARELVATVEPFLQMAQHLTDTIAGWAARCDEVLPAQACAWVDEAVAEIQRINGEIQALGTQGTLLTDGTSQLSSGLAQLSDATAQLAAQAPQLSGGVAQLADGSAQASAGAAALADGTARLAAGAGELHGGTRELRRGTAQLTDGTRQLADGSARLLDGSSELAEGLTDGVEQIPVYSADERRRLSEVAAAPLRTHAERRHAVPVDALALPSAVALGLLAATAAAWAVRPALSTSRLVASDRLARQVLVPLMPTLSVVAIQTVLLLIAVLLSTDLESIGRPAEFTVVAMVAVTALTVLGQGVVAVCGRRLAAALTVIAGLVTLGTVGTGTGSSLADALHTLSPLSPVLKGLEAAQAGTSDVTALVALVLWAALGAGLTMLAAHRARSDLRWLLPA